MYVYFFRSNVYEVVQTSLTRANPTPLSSPAIETTKQTTARIHTAGAAGPTFRPPGMTLGVAVVAVAGKGPDGTVQVLRQQVIRSDHADRERNMQLFAHSAADIATQVVAAVSNNNDDDRTEDSPLDPTEVNSTPEPSTTSKPFASAARRLDRASHVRSNPDAMAEFEKSPLVRYIILHRNQILTQLSTTGSEITLALVRKEEMAAITEGKTTQKTFLGLLSGEAGEEAQAIFAIDLVAGTHSDVGVKMQENSFAFVDTRTTAPLFPILDNQLALHATALAEWQRRTKYCTLCGAQTRLVDGGTASQCKGCNGKSWPRQDPSMIVVISSRDGERVLLGRARRHPPKMYTVLAGFVEAGETFEGAVAREAWEETGVSIDEGSVRYIGSQPWPFPQSCMIGFAATADDTTPLVVDENELEHAAWFPKSDVTKAAAIPGATMKREVVEEALRNDPSLPLLIPSKGVIARKLIDLWLDGKDRQR